MSSADQRQPVGLEPVAVPHLWQIALLVEELPDRQLAELDTDDVSGVLF